MMGDDRPGQVPARGKGEDGAQLCVLLVCFAGSRSASKARRELGQRIRQGGDSLLDEVILEIDAKGKARVFDPRRTVAGTLTPALTWGIFGLLTGGWRSFAIWAVIGAICGGLYAFYMEHLATKDELKRIGERLPSDSSAFIGFAQGSDPQRILSSTASFGPTTASVAAIGADLSAQVYVSPKRALESTATSVGTAPSAPAQTTEVSMLLVRFAGERAARQALKAAGPPQPTDPQAPQVEGVIETNGQGKRRVITIAGSAVTSKASAPGWAVFGLVFGAIVGYTSNGGVLGSVERGLATAIAWGLFGAVAGALYGMWAGRGVSARRLKRIGSLLPPDSSMVVAWAGDTVKPDAIERWSVSGSEQLILHFNRDPHGAVLEAESVNGETP